MIKISHEVPISLLLNSRIWNDYDYCLVHLLPKYKIYRDFFIQSIELGRRVILDNSVFELGKAFKIEEFAYWIKKLRPTEYIIPDVVESDMRTIYNLKVWENQYSDLPGIKIGVVQGKTYSDIIRCYQEVDRVCDKIAISFRGSFYENRIQYPNKYVSWMLGRIYLISMLLRDNIINTNKPHHLLGCSLPQEFLYYKDMPWIESLDTSNPVVHGMHNIRYNSWGLLDKKSIKLVKMIEEDITDKQREVIEWNISKFKQFIL